jgi:hypothetical protein
MAYCAAATVAVVVTTAFSNSIDQVLSRLLSEEVAPAWSKFVKFALLAASFVGGMPAPLTAGFIDRNGPAVTSPVEGESLMIVMKSVAGALMSASWILLVFFGVTLTALSAGRAYAALRKRREAEAKELADRAEERKLEKTRQDRSESHGEPIKRREASEPRPVKQDKPASQPHERR